MPGTAVGLSPAAAPRAGARARNSTAWALRSFGSKTMQTTAAAEAGRDGSVTAMAKYIAVAASAGRAAGGKDVAPDQGGLRLVGNDAAEHRRPARQAGFAAVRAAGGKQQQSAEHADKLTQAVRYAYVDRTKADQILPPGFMLRICAFTRAAAGRTARSGAGRTREKISFIRDTEIENTIRAYATPLFETAGLDPTAVRIYVVADKQINAFVAGGQNLFINTGLITAAPAPSRSSASSPTRSATSRAATWRGSTMR